jgi:gamma-glutamyltranspeptidase
MTEKDSKRKAKLNYTDFSKWLGGSIHMSESFYFRHDSIKNPGYDRAVEKLKKEADNIRKASDYFYKGDIEQKILDKVKFQWKTLRKAFGDLNVEKTGFISKNELQFYLHFWGIDISDQDFQRVFNNFDVDKDGKISYKDFY